MTELKREVVPFKVFYICDRCKKGMMHQTLPEEDKYLHECSYCASLEVLDKVYPYIEYVDRYNKPGIYP